MKIYDNIFIIMLLRIKCIVIYYNDIVADIDIMEKLVTLDN